MPSVLSTLDRYKVLRIVSAVITLLFVRRFVSYLRWRKNLLNSYKIPPPSLFLGNVMDFVNAGGFNEEFFDWLHSNYGEFCGFFLLPGLFNLSISNPDGVAELYKLTRSRPVETYMFLNYLGDDNLLFTHGALVKQLRLRYGSMITNKEQLTKLNTAAIEEFSKLFDSWGEKHSVNVFYEVAPVIYNVMGRVLFGSGWTGTDLGEKIYSNHKYLITNVNKYMILPWLQPFGYMKYLNTIKKWREQCDSLLQVREKELAANPEKWKNDESALTMLLTSKDEKGELFFTRHRAISTVCGFLNGAYDTTHSTIFWLIYNLAKYPDKQDKLRDEVNKYITSTDFSIEDARKCEFLECFIRESMRLKTTVPVNQRINYEEDITLLGKYKIPKGTNVNIPMTLVFQNKEFFGEDPEVFRPERFLSSDPGSEKAKSAWTAFGGFSRMCVGFTFALVELKVILILLVKKYYIRFANENEAFTKKMIEAGVNQPEKRLNFRFVKV